MFLLLSFFMLIGYKIMYSPIAFFGWHLMHFSNPESRQKLQI